MGGLRGWVALSCAQGEWQSGRKWRRVGAGGLCFLRRCKATSTTVTFQEGEICLGRFYFFSSYFFCLCLVSCVARRNFACTFLFCLLLSADLLGLTFRAVGPRPWQAA